MPVPAFIKAKNGDYFYFPQSVPLVFGTAFILKGEQWIEAVIVRDLSTAPDQGSPKETTVATILYDLPCVLAPATDAVATRARIIVDELIHHFVTKTHSNPPPLLDMVDFVDKTLPQLVTPGRKEGA